MIAKNNFLSITKYFALISYFLYNINIFNLFNSIYIFYIKLERNEVDFSEYEAVEIKI
jgi:hypothetical protein